MSPATRASCGEGNVRHRRRRGSALEQRKSGHRHRGLLSGRQVPAVDAARSAARGARMGGSETWCRSAPGLPGQVGPSGRNSGFGRVVNPGCGRRLPSVRKRCAANCAPPTGRTSRTPSSKSRQRMGDREHAVSGEHLVGPQTPEVVDAGVYPRCARNAELESRAWRARSPGQLSRRSAQKLRPRCQANLRTRDGPRPKARAAGVQLRRFRCWNGQSTVSGTEARSASAATSPRCGRQ